MNNAVSAVLAIIGGAISLAIISVLVSQRSQTPAVFSSAGGAIANVIGAAVSPVTGSTIGTGAATGGQPSGVGGLFGVGSIYSQFGSLFGGG